MVLSVLVLVVAKIVGSSQRSLWQGRCSRRSSNISRGLRAHHLGQQATNKAAMVAIGENTDHRFTQCTA